MPREIINLDYKDLPTLSASHSPKFSKNIRVTGTPIVVPERYARAVLRRRGRGMRESILYGLWSDKSYADHLRMRSVGRRRARRKARRPS